MRLLHLFLLLCGLTCMPLPAQGSDSALSNQDKVTYLAKAMRYDRNGDRFFKDGQLVIGVVHLDQSEASLENLVQTLSALQEGESGLTVVVPIVFQSSGQLLTAVKDQSIDLFYVHQSAMAGLSAIQQVSRTLRIPTFGDSKELVQQGLSFGAYNHKGRPRLVINLTSSGREGLDFSAQILGISTVIK